MKLKQSAVTKDVSLVSAGQLPSAREAYVAPRLNANGDVRSVTLGSSPGATESGGGSISRKPAGT